ncbi:hypothetical protein Pint_31924 [Pistacia integerrima]|uniref:Uncharacterized protein n=1 Tax=Pistacia integerrima TaxID=434235 RepID=A0ACC0XQF4_9ROSI|nr:hypothetical protein Pint_31924 [Pistacia integerrima]
MYVFGDTNSEKLRMIIRQNDEEVDEFNFDPKCNDWEDYIVNTHIPGLVRYALRR